MQISKHSVVTVHYRLQKDHAEGPVVEETFGNQPLTFLFGIGQMIPDFESNLEGKTNGDKAAFGIKSDKAYGALNPEAIVDLPIQTFMSEGKLMTEFLVIGKTIPMSDENGRQMMGTIKEVTEATVKVDFNHPMAGQDLFFTTEVVDVRAATEEEVKHGHVHGLGGVQH